MARAARYLLIALGLFTGAGAVYGGILGMSGGGGVSRDLLEGTPFKSYFIPGLILFVFVGLGMLVASLAMILRKAWAPLHFLVEGFILIVWIVVQWALIGYVSVLLPVFLAIGVVVAAFAAYLRRAPALL